MSQTHGTAKYLVISEQLLEEIQRLPKGARCPGIHEIAARYRVARATAEKVIRHLAASGHVQRIPGSGTFATGRRTRVVAILPWYLLDGVTVLPGIRSAHYSRLLDLVADRIREAGHHVEIIPRNGLSWPDLDAVSRVGPDLCVTIADRTEQPDLLAGLGKPVVVVDSVYAGLGADVVTTERHRHTYLATHAVAGAGLTNLHYLGICGPSRMRSMICRDQLAGFEDACRDLGLSKTDRVHLTSDARDLGRRARQILSSDSPPRAMITVGDLSGGLVCTLARRWGIRVPQDMSVLAANGLEPSRVTCLATRAEDMAAAAVDVVLRRLEQPSLPPQVVMVSPVVVDRGTTAPEVVEWFRNLMRTDA